jgi:hypothetical protein
MLKKAEIVKVLEDIPGEEVDLDFLREKLYLLQELQKAEEDIAAGRVYTNEQMKDILASWRQSSGQIQPKTI